MTDSPSETPVADAPAVTPKQALDLLRQRFSVIKDHKPLSIGVDKAVFEAAPEISRKTLRTALRMHTMSTPYLKAMRSAKMRVDLLGAEISEITDEQRQHALQLLQERFNKIKEKKREQEEQERRQEKLRQLADRFGRN